MDVKPYSEACPPPCSVADSAVSLSPRRWFHGTSVALIGADGSGKTTVIDALMMIWPEDCRYVYMGANVQKANYSLPTTRLLTRLKQRALADTLDDSGTLPPAALLSDEQRRRLPRRRIVKALTMINRIMEEWYRQLIVSIFRLRGFVVLCDRHYLFDYSPHRRRKGLPTSVRVHHWILRHLFPRPDLAIFLDAAPEILFRRKPEWTLAHLQRQREEILEQGAHIGRFITVDASLSREEVLTNVAAEIERVRQHSDAK